MIKIMDWQIWVQGRMKYPEVQAKLEDSVESLIDRFFSDSNDYVIEKFCKSFCETICYLGGLMEEREGVSKIYRGEFFTQKDLFQAEEAIEEIKGILKSEIGRLAYNYEIFLTAQKISCLNTASKTGHQHGTNESMFSE